MRWEVEDDDWDRLFGELRQRLVGVARRRELTSYGQLVAGLGGFSGPDSHALHEMLGELQRTNAAASEPLLPALVIYQGGSQPGPGFWRAAEKLGLYSGSTAPAAKDAFWLQQVRAAHDHPWDR